jgi:hypothetical protein
MPPVVSSSRHADVGGAYRQTIFARGGRADGADNAAPSQPCVARGEHHQKIFMVGRESIDFISGKRIPVAIGGVRV